MWVSISEYSPSSVTDDTFRQDLEDAHGNLRKAGGSTNIYLVSHGGASTSLLNYLGNHPAINPAVRLLMHLQLFLVYIIPI